MALIGILFFIFTATCVGALSFFATLDCKVSFGKHGQQSLLQCVVKPDVKEADMEIEMVSWKKEGVEKPLLVFYKGKTTLQTDYMLAEPSWNSKNMNVSLLITNTMVEHAGVYICLVGTDHGYIKGTTNLTVTAKYSEPTVSSVLGKITQNTDGHQEVFATLDCNVSFGKHGQQSLLQCVVKPNVKEADMEIKMVSWKKEGADKPLLTFYVGETPLRKDYMLAEPSLNSTNMNVSLLITNTMVAHAGNYICTVKTNYGYITNTTNLRVTAKYNEPTISSVPEHIKPNTDAALICNSDGGYPEGEIHWIVEHDTEWTEGSEMKAEQGLSGLFHLSSKLTLLPGSTFSKYTCVVVNASGGREEWTEFQIEDKPRVRGAASREEEKSDSTSKIVAPVVVIGSLIVGLLMVLLYLRPRKNGSTNNARKEEEKGLRKKDDDGNPV